MLQAIKLTFGSVWGWLGIIVGAISLVNLGVLYYETGSGPVLDVILANYRSIVSLIFDGLLDWINWKLPHWVKDLLMLYLVFGAATARGCIGFFKGQDEYLREVDDFLQHVEKDLEIDHQERPDGEKQNRILSPALKLTLFIITCLAWWAVLLTFFLGARSAYLNADEIIEETRLDHEDRQAYEEGFKSVYLDLRAILSVNFISTAAAAGLLVVTTS